MVDDGGPASPAPADRELSVDLYRVLAVVVVVLGHWLLAAVTHHDGQFGYDEVLTEIPRTRWLTWLFQVVPVFFMVAGYANDGSWRRWHAGRRIPWHTWYRHRATEILGPTSMYVVTIVAAVAILRAAGIDGSVLTMPMWVLAMHLWFLAVYLGVVALTPLAAWAHDRWGLWVPAALALAVIVVDIVSLGAHVGILGWANYVFCWGAVYQFGVAWHGGALRGRRPAVVATVSAGVLAAAIGLRLYPVSMIGVPGQKIQNTSPPTLALLALAATQAGLLVAISPAVTRWLWRSRWRDVLAGANRMAFGLYLWHMLPVVFVALICYPLGLLPQPDLGSTSWWLWRAVWVFILTLATGVELALLWRARAVFAHPLPTLDLGLPAGVGTPLLVAGAVAVAATLSRFAAYGFAPGGRLPMVSAAVYAVGIVLIGLGPVGSKTRARPEQGPGVLGGSGTTAWLTRPEDL
jgi:surface polysaccharide O-acyltransferase-like enzyme